MSIRKFAIGDLHYGHTNLAKHRGFKTAEEHDDLIKRNWNNAVRPTDIVYILGDLTMEKANYEFLDELNGRKKVILGNHDQPHHIKTLLEHVQTVCGSYEVTIGREKTCILTHIPIHPTMLFNYTANIHGHIHEDNLAENRYINLSADATNYTPVELTFKESTDGHLTLYDICDTEAYTSNKYVWQLIEEDKVVASWTERPNMMQLYPYMATEVDDHETITTKYNALLHNGICMNVQDLPNKYVKGVTNMQLNRFKISQ